MKFQNQVVVITGASSGIGATLAKVFVQEGARVALLARRLERLNELVTQIGQDNTMAIACDVTNYDSVLQAQEKILSHWNQIHVLINNAGVLPPSGPLWQTTPENWQRTINTNINGVFNCIKAILPSMLEKKYGRIISISSSMVKVPGAAAYSISKNTVDVMTEILAEELRSLNTDIIVSSLDPGWVRSEMSPEAPSDPVTVIPRALELASLPKESPSGKKWRA